MIGELPNPMQEKDFLNFVKDKKIQTQILHFGDLYCRTSEARKLYRENFIKNIERQGATYQVQIGKNEKMILDELETIIKKEII
jgi:predicted flavoprotein YhiN